MRPDPAVSASPPRAAPAAEQEALALRLVALNRKRALDPIARFSEIIFGLIMVLSFTGSLSVAESGRQDVRAMLVAALGCNLAWGVVDGVMYVMTALVERTRVAAVIQGIRAAGPDTARDIVLRALPDGVAAVTGEAEADRMVANARALPQPPRRPSLQLDDLRGALGSCLLVLAATLPPTIPFVFVQDVQRALRTSNAVAVGCLFFAGLWLGKATGVLRPWALGLAMVVLGSALVVLTIALGG